jgi:tetratricopeptide (TPR) repeat protein
MRRLVTGRAGCLAILLLLWASPAFAQSKQDKDHARALFQQGVAAYNLGHFAEAAEAYESAYRLVPNAALLFNAAQAHRLAGNKEQALQLYMSYLRNYGNQAGNQADVEHRIENLRQAIADDKAKAEQAEKDRRADQERKEAADRAALERSTAHAITATPAPPPAYKRPLLWGLVAGGAAAIALGVGLGVGLGARGNFPQPNQTLQGN